MEEEARMQKFTAEALKKFITIAQPESPYEKEKLCALIAASLNTQTDTPLDTKPQQEPTLQVDHINQPPEQLQMLR